MFEGIRLFGVLRDCFELRRELGRAVCVDHAYDGGVIRILRALTAALFVLEV